MSNNIENNNSIKHLNLTKLFNKVRLTAKKMRQSANNPPWKNYWHPLKEILDSIGKNINSTNKKASAWIPQNKQITEIVMNEIPEFYILLNGKEQEIEKTIIDENHFIIQTVRIPIQDKPTIRKIIQIALNIGQCQALQAHPKFLQGRTRITDYISHSDIEKLSKFITPDNLNQVNRHVNKF